jgi:hypothetical protein
MVVFHASMAKRSVFGAQRFAIFSGIKVAEFWSFLDALTASTDFAHFLEAQPP